MRIQIAVISLLMLALASFNFVVDPYGIYHPQSSFNFSKNKTEFFLKEPVIKPYRVSDLKPDTIILGMSQAGLGYDEDHPYFAARSTYNFSMAGVSMYMIYRAFQHAMTESELRHVFLDLSVLSFNEYDINVVRNDSNVVSAPFEKLIAVHEDGSRHWNALFSPLTQIPQFLLSSQVTKDSLATLKKQGVAAGWNLNGDGGWRGSTLPSGESQGKRFLKIAKYLFNGYFKDVSTTHPFSIYREDGSLSRAFEYYELLLADAYRNDIQMTLVLSPYHVYFYEALDYLGFGEMFSDWKRNVVLVNERVARQYGKTPFPVWDFAYYSELTTERVPGRESTTARMKSYYDPLHFTRDAGNHVLDQVYLGRSGTGIEVTAENLDSMLVMQQQNKQTFHREHPELIRQLKDMFRRASGTQPR